MNRDRSKDGVTILEVLFAAGIAAFGLIGIASMLALATRQALQATESVEGQAYASAWHSEFTGRNLHNPANWAWFRDRPVNNMGFIAFDNSSTFSTGTTVANSTRTGYRHAICFDPSFYADPVTRSNLSVTTQPVYRPGLFPYYQDNYDPTSSPASPTLANIDMPRLLRVTLNVGGNPIVGKYADELARSRDDFSKFEPEDKSLSSQRLFTSGRAETSAKYSWFATLCPREFLTDEVNPNFAFRNLNPGIQTENYYTLSMVVCRQRVRVYDPTLYPQEERVMSVVSAPTPFRDGSGGRIQLGGFADANRTFSDQDLTKIMVGDWVMLAKKIGLGGTNSMTVCRWYRIIGLDAEPTINFTTDTWTRWVVLDGPDWDFSSGGATQATLVNDVATVLERVIQIN